MALTATPLSLARGAPSLSGSRAVPMRMLSKEPGAAEWLAAAPIEIGSSDVLGGLTWSGAAPVRAQVRVRSAKSWSKWIGVDPLRGHLPDAVETPSATSPIWFGDASAIQFRTSRAADGLQIQLMSAGSRSGGTSPAEEIAGAPPYISRRAWGAQSPRTGPAFGRVRLAFVHHTVTANAYTREDSPTIVKSIQDYHRNVLGWNDIGYNALVDRFGQIFEGRAGGLKRAVVGAQAQGFNEQSTGVAVIGDHGSEPATPETIRALAKYLAWKLSIHELDPAGRARVVSAGGESSQTSAGTRVILPRICGHREADLTACPGDALASSLPELRRRVDRLSA